MGVHAYHCDGCGSVLQGDDVYAISGDVYPTKTLSESCIDPAAITAPKKFDLCGGCFDACTELLSRRATEAAN